MAKNEPAQPQLPPEVIERRDQALALMFEPNAEVLAAVAGTDVAKGGMMFMPQTMGEAMEFAKLMAASNFVRPHLRGRPGDCMALVMQAARWQMDPYAVANKSYFVNDQMAYEAQLVAAVVHTRAPIIGRPSYEFQYSKDGKTLEACTVTCMLRGDPEPKEVTAYMGGIKTRNSPLWVQQPEQQLGYYTIRMWARRHVPEVILGVYTGDELQTEADAEGIHRVVDTTNRPQRRQFAAAEGAAVVETGDGKSEGQQQGGEAAGGSEDDRWGLIDHVGDEVENFAKDEDGTRAYVNAIVVRYNAAPNQVALDTLLENNPLKPLPESAQEWLRKAYTERQKSLLNPKGKGDGKQGGML